jgi:hypothetical protein
MDLCPGHQAAAQVLGFSLSVVQELPSALGLQLLKKLSQCLAILKRLTYGKSNKLHNNLKIIYVILGHLGAQTNPRSCDLV